MKALITVGCKTDHSGIIVLGDSSFLVESKAVHLDGMTHFCPKCKTTVSAISSGKGFLTVSSKTIIMAGDFTSCGAIFLPQQNLAVRSNGTGNANGRSSSNSTSSRPSYIPISQPELSNNFSKVPSKSPQLTEDDILLTGHEANLLFYRCFKQKVNPVTLEHRKLATEMYWKLIDADEGGLSVLQYIFEAVFGGDWRKPDARGTIEDIGMDQAGKAYEHAKNDARMKYFKVRDSGDIDGRIGDAGQAGTAGLQMTYKNRFAMLQ